jgi:hypothetical protein
MGGNASSWRGRRNGHQSSQRNRRWRRIGYRRGICTAAARGARVVVADLQADRGATFAAEIGGVFASVDVTKTEQIEGPLRGQPNSGQFGSAYDLDAYKKVIARSIWSVPSIASDWPPPR